MNMHGGFAFGWVRTNEHRRSAFSLVEVMVAILILGVALVGLVQGVSTALVSNKESEAQSAAALLAAGKIEALRADAFGIDDGETQGDFGDELPLYQWRQTIRAARIEGLHEVSVVVENAKSGKTIFELKTMLFDKPYISEEEEQAKKDKDKDKRKRRSSSSNAQ